MSIVLKMKKFQVGTFLLAFHLGSMLLSAQQITFPQTFGLKHPCLLTNSNNGKKDLEKLLTSDAEAQKIYDEAVNSIASYVVRHQKDTSWIVSRLQMYWQSHATNVYIKGGVYSHADGHAPVPTVRFTGTRDAVTNYGAPRLEDIVPYMDDVRGLYYVNSSLPGSPMEWVDQSKTGRIIESINRQIMHMAETAAFIYWYTGDVQYGKFACDLFDTYMTGMYYRNEPVDLNHSHNQTLVGLSSFEVIHEDILNELTVCYDFLYDYLKAIRPAKMKIYADVFKKWAELIIKNGVPFNNWDLIEARFIASIALILQDNSQYPDGKGCQYYIDQIFNKNTMRQWSIPKLIHYGLDPNTGIWAECPGYSQNVIGDFAGFITLFDNTLNFDLLPQVPIIPKAILATAQYMYPNGNIVGFGDTHYGILSTNAMQQMVVNAQHFQKSGQEILFTKMMKMMKGFTDSNPDVKSVSGQGFRNLFTRSDFGLNDTIKPGKYWDFVTAAFYAPNVSWFVQRNGLDRRNALMISEAGSLGNHMHSNGIAMELYGQGLVLAPEGGIGTSYFQPDYAEYYSQFPAHNTVVVDGISKYPEMKSNHPFELLGCYPASGQRSGYFPFITYSDVYFLEPETQADQHRLMSIIRTGDSSGYYVDIFRSRRKDGKDKYHDYFYHNLGQELVFKDKNGKLLDLKPSEKLSFADGDLFAYDYLWNKKSTVTNQDFNAIYTLSLPDDDIYMNVWMKGYPDREIFSAKSPPSKAWGRTMIPKDISELPLNTIVVRQTGQAWTRPFAAIFEPSASSCPGNVSSVSYLSTETADSSAVAIKVETKDGNDQYILSSVSGHTIVHYKELSFRGVYGVVSETHAGLQYLFLGKGKFIQTSGYGITATDSATSAALSISDGNLWLTSHAPVVLTLPDTYKSRKVSLRYKENNMYKAIPGKKARKDGRAVVFFQIPAMDYQKIEVNEY